MTACAVGQALRGASGRCHDDCEVRPRIAATVRTMSSRLRLRVAAVRYPNERRVPVGNPSRARTPAVCTMGSHWEPDARRRVSLMKSRNWFPLGPQVSINARNDIVRTVGATRDGAPPSRGPHDVLPTGSQREDHFSRSVSTSHVGRGLTIAQRECRRGKQPPRRGRVPTWAPATRTNDRAKGVHTWEATPGRGRAPTRALATIPGTRRNGRVPTWALARFHVGRDEVDECPRGSGGIPRGRDEVDDGHLRRFHVGRDEVDECPRGSGGIPRGRDEVDECPRGHWRDSTWDATKWTNAHVAVAAFHADATKWTSAHVGTGDIPLGKRRSGRVPTWALATGTRRSVRVPTWGTARSVREPPEHRADAIERLVDGGEIGRRDVAARSRDPQRGSELACRACGATVEVRAIEARALAALADVERNGLGRAADFIGETLAALPQLPFERSELFQNSE